MPETTDQKSFLGKLEKSYFWRWILVIAAIIGIASGIYTFIDKKESTLNTTSYIFTTDVTTIVLAVIFLVISSIIVLTASITFKPSKKRDIKPAASKHQTNKNIDASNIASEEKPREGTNLSKEPLSPTSIGFFVGLLYGLLPASFLVLMVIANDKSYFAASIFWGTVIIFIFGFIGIIPANLGWYFQKLNHVYEIGMVITVFVGFFIIMILGGLLNVDTEMGDGFLSMVCLINLILFGPLGWLGTFFARHYRLQEFEN